MSDQGKGRASRATWLERAKALPSAPGVYLMKGRDGEVLYVGKAKNLRARVSAYFQEGSSDYRAFVGVLSRVLHDLETAVTRSEKEALLLERELIRRHEPRFNVIWRDDKQYLCLRIDPSHEYPWVQVVRQMGKDGARYFGPFHSASAARQTLRVVNRHFQLRTCRDSVLYHRTRPCLEYQIGRCPAPCVFEIDRDKYAEGVQHVLMFLEGKGKQLFDRLEQRMWTASDRMEFEVAAHYRNQMRAVEKTLEKQKIALPSLLDQDVFGLYREGDDLCISVLEVRDGRVRDVRSQLFEGAGFGDADLLESFILQRYADAADGGDAVPRELVVPLELASAEVLTEILQERRGRKVEVKRPARGDRIELLELAAQNAKHGFEEGRRKSGALERTLVDLRKRLRLRNVPRRMECFDISNLGGKEIVGSKVLFSDALPDKSGYRRYKIRSTPEQDDFASMYEVLVRRFKQGTADPKLPDLVVIDGGKGQLNAARMALRDRQVESVDVIALAKSRVLSDGEDSGSERSPERVFVPNARDPVVLPQRSAELLLLARLRDEAHRFAITFQREVRRRARIRSELDEVPGIGPTRRNALLKHLGSMNKVREASVAELAGVPGIGPKAAARIHGALHGGPEQGSGEGQSRGEPEQRGGAEDAGPPDGPSEST